MPDINKIEYKKPLYPVRRNLKVHLVRYSRWTDLPIAYEDLLRYTDLMPLVDKSGKETLWYGALYEQSERDHFQDALRSVYELLKGSGVSVSYLKIASIEFCSFGNSKPFRIKVVNEINDNHDYYYIKRADASRIYGLELEEIFSPDKVSFLVGGNTLVEEHIVGIPCDEFMLKNKEVKIENRIRFAKEFVKFNERCFTRLLGDMRPYNFVVEITQDFDNVQYRLRAIDFDQQAFEGRKSIYLPQYYKDNRELVDLASELLSNEVVDQYKREELEGMKKRFFANRIRAKSLINSMRKDRISTPEHIQTLRTELARHHADDTFLTLTNMGDVLAYQLKKQLNIDVL